MQVIFSTAYFPPVSWFAMLVSNEFVRIEKHEHFIKQTYRNRCHIASANGLLALSVPVIHGKGKKSPVHQVRINQEAAWQKNHWRALESAYNKSPYFEFYRDSIEFIFNTKQEFLFDLNFQTIELLMQLLKIDRKIEFTEEYIDCYPSTISDFRNSIHPKKNFPSTRLSPYQQVFSEKYGFLPDLSILDLLFCKGPEAKEFLKFE